MPDREKLIKELRWWADGCDRTNRGCQVRTLLERAADELENGVVVQRWIPVTERLPGTEKVLITDGEIVMRGYRRPDGVWKYGVELHEVWERLSLKRVTHWMPLPEPPKEG